jgi:hypothetical protein
MFVLGMLFQHSQMFMDKAWSLAYTGAPEAYYIQLSPSLARLERFVTGKRTSLL